MRKTEMTGLRFGRLVVKNESGKSNHLGNAMWDCQCDCGKVVSIVGSYLRKGATKSCGCLREKHGYANRSKRHPLYKIWVDIKKRCCNDQSGSFSNYGGRGIKVCDTWVNDPESFILWAVKEGWQKGLFIDRIENDKGYSPDNCRFVTRQINNSNKTTTYKNNSSGIRGVMKTKSGKYSARIDHINTPYWLGTFSTMQEAEQAIKNFRESHKLALL